MRKYNPYSQFFCLYFISHLGILLLYNGIFWDDWTLFNSSANTLLETFREAGTFFNISGYIHLLLLKVGPWMYKLLTFSFMFMSGTFLYRILLRQTWLDENYSFLITTLFLLIPLNAARVTMICFPYTFSYFLFFLAWFIMPRNKWLSVTFFFFSFNTQSFLVFYILPLLEMLINYLPGRVDIRRVYKFFIKNIAFIVAPILFWIIKMLFFKPTGLFAGYNEQFSITNLINAPKPMIADLLMIRVSKLGLLILIVFTIIFFMFPSFGDFKKSTTNNKHFPVRSSRLFWTASIVLFAGLFPYLILGYSPTFHEWSSRHQLLMPLGIAFLIAWIVSCLPQYITRVVIVIVLAVSISADIVIYRDFYNDIKKQETIVSFFQNNPVVADADVIVMEDATPKAISRKYRFYELTGMMSMASDNQRHFVLPSYDDMAKYNTGSYDKMFTRIYKAAEHLRKPTPKVIRLMVVFEKQRLLFPNTYNVVITM